MQNKRLDCVENYFSLILQYYFPQTSSLIIEKEICLSPMTKALTSTENSKKQRDNIKKRHQNLDYTLIADRLRTVSGSSSSHPTGVVKLVYESSTFPLTATFL